MKAVDEDGKPTTLTVGDLIRMVKGLPIATPVIILVDVDDGGMFELAPHGADRPPRRHRHKDDAFSILCHWSKQAQDAYASYGRDSHGFDASAEDEWEAEASSRTCVCGHLAGEHDLDQHGREGVMMVGYVSARCSAPGCPCYLFRDSGGRGS